MRSLARADRDARFPAHEKQRRFENRSVLVFAVRVARVPPARVNSLSIFSSTHVCSYPSLVLDFFSLEKVDFSACRFDFFQRASGLRWLRGKPTEREAHDEEEFFFKLKLTNTKISHIISHHQAFPGRKKNTDRFWWAWTR